MNEIKFKRFNIETKQISDVPEDYKLSDIDGFSIYIYLQYLGLEDANNKDLYQGDIIELHITKELMKSSFCCSNLGKYCGNHPEVTDILLIFDNPTTLTMKYKIAQKINGNLDYDEDGNLNVSTYGEDSNFPQYLIFNGAIYIGNILEMESILTKNFEDKESEYDR